MLFRSFESTIDDVVFLCAPHFALNDVYTPLKTLDMKNIRITNNKSNKTGTKAWSASGFNGVLIDNNVCSENRGDCIWTGEELSAGSSLGSLNVIISNNKIYNAFGGFGSLKEGYPSEKDISLDGISFVGVFTHHGHTNKVEIINNTVTISSKINQLNKNFYLFNIYISFNH